MLSCLTLLNLVVIHVNNYNIVTKFLFCMHCLQEMCTARVAMGNCLVPKVMDLAKVLGLFI